jgi:hypothetical protein
MHAPMMMVRKLPSIPDCFDGGRSTFALIQRWREICPFAIFPAAAAAAALYCNCDHCISFASSGGRFAGIVPLCLQALFFNAVCCSYSVAMPAL